MSRQKKCKGIARQLRYDQLEDRRMLAVFVVSNLDDAGPGSLRDTVALANGFAGADEIQFAVNGTIALTSGEIEITDPLIITGPGADQLTIDAQQNSRIFNVTETTGNYTFRDLTITGGRTTGSNNPPFVDTYSGGAISSRSSGVTIENSTISNSATEGDYARGGGVFVRGSLELINSTVTGNHTIGRSAYGGGLSTDGLTLVQSTISGNSTAGIQAYGGGIFSGQLDVTFSTVTDNHTSDPTATGGGVFSADSGLHLDSSIVSGNTAGGGGNDVSPGRPIGSAKYSLIGDTSGLDQNQLLALQDIDDGNIIDLDPMLSPLTNNGGPTLTHALLSGSPAINAGNLRLDGAAYGLEFDQRGEGYLREQFERMDIGAYEVQQPTVGTFLTVSTATDEVDYDFSTGQMSLREAVMLANLTPGMQTIRFSSALSGQTITLNGTHIEITDELTIDGTALSNRVTIDANHQSRIFNIDESLAQPSNRVFDVTMKGLILTRGNATTLPYPFSVAEPNSGGAIRQTVRGLLTLDRIDITDSKATLENGNGGAVRANYLMMTDSLATGNTAMGDNAEGGALSVWMEATIVDSTLSGNLAPIGGGLAARNVVINNATIADNIAGAGGGIWAYVDATIDQSEIVGNSANGNGAGVSAGERVIVNDSVISNNKIDEGAFFNASGGGIIARDVEVHHSTIANNTAKGQGGGILADRTVTIVDSTVKDNQTNGDGGGVWGRLDVTLIRSTVSGNRTMGSSGRGAGVFADDDVTVDQSTISGNTAYGSGSYAGGLLAADSITITSSTITGNRVMNGEGGGVHHADTGNDSITIRNSVIAGNISTFGGPDLNHRSGGTSNLTVEYSLIGDTTESTIDETTGTGNLINIDPLLGPLADNGGSSQTHALLPGSPALNSGDPTIPFVAGETDQRSVGHARVAFNRIDVGAYEAQVTPSADFDTDGDQDGQDFLAWQRGFGNPNAVRADGNSDDDTDVDASDLEAWRFSYGQPQTMVVAVVSDDQSSEGIERAFVDSAAASLLSPAASYAELVDAAVTQATREDDPSVSFDHLIEARTAVEAALVATDADDDPFTSINELDQSFTLPFADALAVDSSQVWLTDELLQRVFG